MKEWALEHGATHFTHWFLPMTGATAEKHDAFINWDEPGVVIEKFSGSQLIQGEPDASSFPSGGLRATFEARGYTIWDTTSPAFLMEGPLGTTLCIPTAFVGYHGEALDNKVPLLRSMEAVSQLRPQGPEPLRRQPARRCWPSAGPEQEYFLVDLELARQRPDLMFANRTLQGARPPKGQELEDHYFGSIKERVLGFMQEVELECFKLGIPAKTRHNEVAPNQFEMAPIYEPANIASDHNQLMMELMKAVGERHGLAALLHEKPFAGINGSRQARELEPGHGRGPQPAGARAHPGENVQFLYLPGRHPEGHPPPRRTVPRGHRLRRQRPPAGRQRGAAGHHVGLPGLPAQPRPGGHRARRRGRRQREADPGPGPGQPAALEKDATDRNRTSPFAFTGNKFEFRAVGSSQAIAFPLTVINAIVAEALDEMNARMEAELAAGRPGRAAAMEVIREAIAETQAHPLRGQQLLARVAAGGGTARPAPCPGHRWPPCGCGNDPASPEGVHPHRHPHHRGTGGPHPHPPRAVPEGHRHRGPGAAGDGRDHAAAGRPGGPGGRADTLAKLTAAGVQSPAPLKEALRHPGAPGRHRPGAPGGPQDRHDRRRARARGGPCQAHRGLRRPACGKPRNCCGTSWTSWKRIAPPPGGRSPSTASCWPRSSEACRFPPVARAARGRGRFSR